MINGIGTIHYGKRNYRADGNAEIFDTTKWFAVFWLPLFPLGSYTIERERRQDLIQAIARTGFSRETIYIHGRRPLDLPQVLTTYVKSWVGVGLIVWAIASDQGWSAAGQCPHRCLQPDEQRCDYGL